MRNILFVFLVGILMTGCASTPDIKNHNACFLMDNAATRMMNILSPHLPRDEFKSLVGRQKAAGANMVYVYTMNEHDGPWTPYSFYQGNAIGGAIDEVFCKEMQKRCDYIRDEGLGIIIVLRADDSPGFNKSDGGRQHKYQEDAVSRFDEYASAYWVGLELDEYYNSSTVESYASHLQSLTKKPILTHQIPGRWDMGGLPSVDGAAIQYGFNKNRDYILNMTKKAVANLGSKPVYGVEYHKSSATEQACTLGDAVIEGGGQGTGNNRHNPPKSQSWFDRIF